MANCPNCKHILTQIDDGNYICPNCGKRYVAKRRQTVGGNTSATTSAIANPTQQPNTVQKTTNDELQQLKERIAALESEKQQMQKASKAKSQSTFGAKVSAAASKVAATPAWGWFKKHWYIAVASVLGLIIFITLMTCLVGIRGIYVNINNPNDFYDFDATSYRASADSFLGTDELEEGTWKVSGNKLILTVKDEDFGKMSVDFEFDRNGYSTLFIDGVQYKRVSLVGLKTTAEKVKVTFDPQNGQAPTVKKIKIGSRLNETVGSPERAGSHFLGWYSKPDGEGAFYNEINRIWENTTYYADWDIEFNVDNEGVLVGILGNTNTIPSNIVLSDGITKIGRNAFKDCTNLRSITLPNSVKSIETSAFEGCSNLQQVSLGMGLTAIGESAFKNCAKLSNINFPESLTTLGRYAFSGCNFTSLTIPNGVKDIYSSTFEGCDKIETANIPASAISAITKQNLKTINITSGTAIPSSAFYGCELLANVNLSESITAIYSDAFRGCEKLRSIIIPNSVINIGSNAFYNCINLTNLTLGMGIKTIENSAFGNCKNLSKVSVSSLVSWCNIDFDNYSANPIHNGAKLYIDGQVFEKELIIPNEITHIGSYAFYGFTDITSVTIPQSMNSIGAQAFVNCSSLQSVCISNLAKWCEIDFGNNANPLYNSTAKLYLNGKLLSGHLVIPEGVKRIGSNAFRNCTDITSLSFPSTLTEIGDNAFNSCSSLIDVNVPKNLNTVGWGTFWKCSNLQSVNITDLAAWCKIEFGNNEANPLYNSGAKLYINGNELTELIVPNEITKIGSYAFYNCKSITNLVIHNNVTEIGSSAFYGCNGIESATMPTWAISFVTKNNLKTVVLSAGDEIEERALRNCSSLVSVTMSDSIKSIGIEAFRGCTSLNSVIIGSGVVSICDRAFYGCTNLNSIELGKSVSNIGENVFYNCALSAITVNSLNTNFMSVDGILYDKTSIEIIFIPQSINGDISILDGVKTIQSSMFSHCENIISIILPESITSIQSWAFYGCKNLVSIIMGNNVEFIEDYAFRDCDSLKNLTIGNKVTSIGNGVFDGCNNLEEIIVSINNKKYLSNNGILYLKDPLEIIHIPTAITGDIEILSGITKIDNEAFENCINLASIKLPNTVETIGYWVFSGCTSLNSINIPSSVVSLGSHAFKDCISLESIFIPESLINIGEALTEGCKNLSEIVVAETNPKYYSMNNCLIEGKTIIAGCSTSVIPSDGTVTSIGGYAFAGTGIKVANLNSITNLGYEAFYNCTELDDIVITDKVTHIGCDAFTNTAWYNKQADGIVYLGNWAIKYKGSNISSVRTLTIKDGTTNIGDNAFMSCSSLTTITFPEGVTEIPDSALYYTAVTTVYLPSTLRQISVYGWDNLRNIHFNGTVYQWNHLFSKGYASNMDISKIVVHCSDGNTDYISK